MNAKTMNRRKFIQQTSVVMAGSLVLHKTISAAGTEPVVWEIEGNSDAAVVKLFESFGGLETLLPKGAENSTIILKPNLCLPHNSKMATTTSIELMDAMCQYLSAKNVKKIIITDHTLQQAERFMQHDIVKLEEQYSTVKVMLANEQRYYQQSTVDGKVLKNAEILKILPRADFIINMAAAKHHTATHVSLAIKNLMGLIWDRSAFHTQMDLQQAIADLTLAIHPHLNIIDAKRVLLKGGPTGPGPVINDNRLFTSTDILALDSVVAARYSFNGKTVSPKEVPHLWAAFQNGVGEIDLQKIKVQKLAV